MEKNKEIITDSYGITSVCKNGKHIYMGDIDKFLEDSQIRRIVNKLMDYWFLSDCLVIETLNGFNLVSFDKLSLQEIYEINKNIADIDKAFNQYNYMRKYYTLRLAPDKSVYGYYLNTRKYIDVEKSNGHREFFNNLFNIKIPKDERFDGEHYFQIVRYEDSKVRV